MEGTPKKGMSKGCLVGLIIGGIVLAIVIIGGVTCWIYKEDLAKSSMTMMVDGMKQRIVDEQVVGVDTVQFNAVADAFSEKLKNSELDAESYQAFFQKLQVIAQAEQLDAEGVDIMTQAMTEYFPDLKEMIPPELPVDTTAVEELTTE